MTEVIPVNAENPEASGIERAAALIRNGGLVAFPTETVYGLGADAVNEQAIRRLFEAKGRPPDNPLIVHIGSRAMLDMVAASVSPRVEMLIEACWPGPLTIVLNRRPEVPPAVSAGLPTVAVRMPNNAVALALIRAAGTPIAAPSANRSGRPSPTTAAHVLLDLEGRIDLILDGGPTRIGIESTVLDMTGDVPAVLRLGWLTRERLAELVGEVRQSPSEEELQRSPGTRYRHYSPRARVVLVEDGSPFSLAEACHHYLPAGTVGFIGHSKSAVSEINVRSIMLEPTAADYARRIYSAFREMDEHGVDVVVVEGISEQGEGAAVMDRLRRAASEAICGDAH